MKLHRLIDPLFMTAAAVLLVGLTWPSATGPITAASVTIDVGHPVWLPLLQKNH